MTTKKQATEKKTAQTKKSGSTQKKKTGKSTQKQQIENFLNNLTADATVSYSQNGSVCIHIAPWNEVTEVTEQPKTIRGRMVFQGKYHEGDGGVFIPYQNSEKAKFHTVLKTAHGELKTTEKRVQVQFSFWKSEGKEKSMKELYKEVLEMKRFVKQNTLAYQKEEDVEWEKMK